MSQTSKGAALAQARRLGLRLADYEQRIARGEQRCQKCAAWKELAEFGVDASRTRGRKMVCRDCYASVSTTTGPGVRERGAHALAGEAWCQVCAAWLPASAVTGGKCRPHHAAYARTRYATDAGVRAARRQHSHARRRGTQPIPARAQDTMLSSAQGLCVYCGTAPATTWDHIIPLSHGGETTPWNIVPCCASCNSSKGKRPLVPWLAAKGFTPSPQVADAEVLEHATLAR